MSEFEKVAIIGASGRFPLADSIDKLDELFVNKIDTIRKPSQKRIKLQGAASEAEFAEAGFLDDVEYFDHDFFHIPKAEAIYMDPQQRLALEIACDTIASAGYSLEDMRGSNTAVIVGAHDSCYADLLTNRSGVAVIGNFTDIIAGRISYCLDLRGEAAIVQTACSSSLYALYDACIKINAHQADMALAGSVYLRFDMHEQSESNPVGVNSADGRCKTFDERADGINNGEGGGFVLLKSYEKAVNDGDNILAVIDVIAANQDGNTSNSLTAPSTEAQRDLLLRAWKMGDVDPTKLGYIEAHGTGTKLGDPIEVSALSQAISQYTDKTSFIPVGSLKTNFSHFGSFAGIASVLKGVLEFKTNKKYPLQNFQKANPLIDFEHSAVYPIQNTEEWTDEKKFFAVNAFGMSGTNVHAIMENYVAPERVSEGKQQLVTLSVRYSEVYDQYVDSIISKLDGKNLDDVAYTLNIGRDAYTYRTAVIASSVEELITKLKSSRYKDSRKEQKYMILCSGDSVIGNDSWNELLENHPGIKELYKEGNSTEENYFLQREAVYQYLKGLGFEFAGIVGSGKGNILVDYLTGEKNLSEAVSQLKSEQSARFNREAFEAYMEKLLQKEDYIFVEFGEAGELTQCIEDMKTESKTVALTSESFGLDELLAYAFEAGLTINWKKYYEGKTRRRVELPGHPFRKVEVWPQVKQLKKNDTEAESEEKIATNDIAGFIKKLWLSELGINEINPDDDFFDLGGNSLISINIMDAVGARIGQELDIEIMYDYPTLDSFTEYVRDISGENDTAEITDNSDENNDNTNADLSSNKEKRERNSLISGNQEILLKAQENTDFKGCWDMPNLLKLKGNLNPEALKKSIERVIRENDILRTYYKKENDTYIPVVNEKVKESVFYYDWSNKDEEEILKELRTVSNTEFKLFEPGNAVICSTIAKAKDDVYYWVLNVHHIASDGWSAAVLYSAVNNYYIEEVTGKVQESIPISQMSEYVASEHEFVQTAQGEKQKNFWIEEIKDMPKYLNVPLDHDRKEKRSYTGQNEIFLIEPEVFEKAKQVVKNNQISLYTLAQFVYGIQLAKRSKQNEFMVGVPLANRKNQKLQGAMGFISNILPIKFNIDWDNNLKDELKKVAEFSAKMLRNCEYPYWDLCKDLGEAGEKNYNPLYQDLFVYHNYANADFTIYGCETDYLNAGFKGSKYDLLFTMREMEHIMAGALEYNDQLFDKDTILNFIEEFKTIFTQIVESENWEETLINTWK